TRRHAGDACRRERRTRDSALQRALARRDGGNDHLRRRVVPRIDRIVFVGVSYSDGGVGSQKRSIVMAKICSSIVRFIRDESGTETLEWGLVCGLIVVGAITAIALIGPKVSDMWNDVNNEIPAAKP